MRLSGRVGERGTGIVETEIAQTPRGEDELAREAQQIKRAGTVGFAEGAKCFVVLAQEDVRIAASAKRRIVVLTVCMLNELAVAWPCLQLGQIVVSRAVFRIEKSIQTVGQFHQMGICVVNDTVLDIGHGNLQGCFFQHTPNSNSRKSGEPERGEID